MLFNSAEFLLIFLPIVVALFAVLRRVAPAPVLVVLLLLASLVFYGVWDWRFLPLLLLSIAGNWLIAGRIATAPPAQRRGWLFAGIGLNLAALGWFKYALFVAAVLRDLTPLDPDLGTIVLPIGISFYTFQQIAYLVDVSRDPGVSRDPLRYGLFVSFFPQLIAGPIVHHREVVPQLALLGRRPLLPDLAVGLAIFSIGLVKKLWLADSFARIATPLFTAAAAGEPLGLVPAWAAATGYGLQIYFDFSAYSDMAIGLARMFGVVLPLNFASPYKATSVVDFWRRWHITLSRFLRDYLYIPLGGGRVQPWRRRLNVLVTMLLGGIWHGAGWTFVLWGALHGVMIVIAQWWQARPGHRPLPNVAARALTLTLVLAAWVPFRAADLSTTLAIWASMAGLDGAGARWPTAPPFPVLAASGRLLGWSPTLPAVLAVLAAGLMIVLAAPNTQTLFRDWSPGLTSRGYESGIAPRRAAWRPSPAQAALVGLALGLCLLKLNDVSEFIYFQF